MTKKMMKKKSDPKGDIKVENSVIKSNSGRKAIPDEVIIEMLENNVNMLNQTELAACLGITQPALSKRLTKLRHMIKDKATEIAEKLALSTVLDLQRQSSAGNSASSKLLLELAGVYKQTTQVDINTVIKEKLESINQKGEDLAEKYALDHSVPNNGDADF